jgi:hypothetical protein
MNNNTNDPNLKTLVGRTISFEALHNVFIRANRVFADVSELNVSNSISGKTIKHRIDEIKSKIYTSSNNPKIDETDILKGIVVFVEETQRHINTVSESSNLSGTQIEFSKLNTDNPYTVDTSIGYQLQNSEGNSYARTQSYSNNNDIILNLELPPKLLSLNIGDSVNFTIINQGTHSLILNDTTDYKIIGFPMIYDVTSAQFKIHKVSENNYNVYRLT